MTSVADIFLPYGIIFSKYWYLVWYKPCQLVIQARKTCLPLNNLLIHVCNGKKFYYDTQSFGDTKHYGNHISVTCRGKDLEHWWKGSVFCQWVWLTQFRNICSNQHTCVTLLCDKTSNRVSLGRILWVFPGYSHVGSWLLWRVSKTQAHS